MTPQSTSLIVDPKHTIDLWCVYEHLMQIEPDGPPVVIYVNACKLSEVYRLTQGRQNTEWLRLTKDRDVKIMVRIVATDTDRYLINREAMRHARIFNPMPICNLRGFNIHGQGRSVECSNGKRYKSQADAAKELGLSQSAISKHLNGQLRHVGGYVFSYPTGTPENLE